MRAGAIPAVVAILSQFLIGNIIARTIAIIVIQISTGLCLPFLNGSVLRNDINRRGTGQWRFPDETITKYPYDADSRIQSHKPQKRFSYSLPCPLCMYVVEINLGFNSKNRPTT